MSEAQTMSMHLPLEKYIHGLERDYEFLLGFAAQGREDDSDEGQTARSSLTSMQRNLEQLSLQLNNRLNPFEKVTLQDVEKVQAALELILDLPRINSEIIDNLNASIHLRALLTDLFLISEAAKLATAPGQIHV